jgi:hypothetical protein
MIKSSSNKPKKSSDYQRLVMMAFHSFKPEEAVFSGFDYSEVADANLNRASVYEQVSRLTFNDRSIRNSFLIDGYSGAAQAYEKAGNEALALNIPEKAALFFERVSTSYSRWANQVRDDKELKESRICEVEVSKRESRTLSAKVQ